jgi:hypothetical protein
MGLSLGGLVRAATESTLNIVMPGRGLARTIESGDPTHLIPFGQSYKEWGTQLSSVLKKPAAEAFNGFVEGTRPELERIQSGWRFLSDHKEELSDAAALTAPGGPAVKATIENPSGAMDIVGRAWKLLALGQT